jgi:hypothetical protein
LFSSQEEFDEEQLEKSMRDAVHRLNSVGIDEEDADDASEGVGAGGGVAEELDDEDEDEVEDVRRTSEHLYSSHSNM